MDRESPGVRCLGLEGFITSHPDNNVSDYTKSVESKLKKKREENPIGQPVTIKGKAEDAEVIDDAKGKEAMLDGINRTAEKAEDGELDIF